MNNKEKIEYFNENLKAIIKQQSNSNIDYIINIIDEKQTIEAISLWPSEIKIILVDKYIDEISQ
tara:strand:+ start:122 stop:313 length:192 start_codon:yes stop_codon:yes gene_type:complete